MSLLSGLPSAAAGFCSSTVMEKKLVLISRNPSGSNNELLNDDESDDVVDDEYLEKIRDADFLKTELERVESMEEILEELEDYYIENMGDVDDDDEDLLIGGDENLYPTDDGVVLWSEEKLQEILGNLPDDDELEVELLESIRTSDEQVASTSTSTPTSAPISSSAKQTTTESLSPPNESTSNDETELGNIAPSSSSSSPSSLANLERALLQGVVPVSANVGSDCLPGDFGFDPLSLATKDYFDKPKTFFVNLLPEPPQGNSNMVNSRNDDNNKDQDASAVPVSRPKALILRDYREAEIRHGRLAMLAAMFWPLQEMLDQFVLEPDQAGPLLYGPVTLPYFPLLMTFILLNLGYLDIYSQAIKDRDSIGEAFLPGDCFWDPLKILEGAPDSMKRNMQERELFNGRVAMLAVAAFIWEEAITHLPLMDIGDNELLLKPAYEVPYIQEWLDSQFSSFDAPSDQASLEQFMDNSLE
eukprot:CAMPEP_0172439296 /NCGR_PEP_ID=MMETSP1065-20121228/335_1 /TAXON_ID=265537 /ORGANISM="Amphiprora paludosa, Strain CCMP125" /LENGTH=472 /DNA_ID=CAMNT_0013187961 /DNA_START=107 /DNA_END=1527 /DNA_ORIENTATION=-